MHHWFPVLVAISGILLGRMAAAPAHDPDGAPVCAAADLESTVGYLGRPASDPGDFVRPGFGGFAWRSLAGRDHFAAPSGTVGEAEPELPSRSLQQQHVRLQI